MRFEGGFPNPYESKPIEPYKNNESSIRADLS